MIKDILEQIPFIKVEGNIINLGYKNSWMYNADIVKAVTALNQYVIPGSQSSETIANCVTEYRFVVDDGSERYIVVSKVDSGD